MEGIHLHIPWSWSIMLPFPPFFFFLFLFIWRTWRLFPIILDSFHLHNVIVYQKLLAVHAFKDSHSISLFIMHHVANYHHPSCAFSSLNSWRILIPAYSIITLYQRAKKIGVLCIHADCCPSRKNNRLYGLLRTAILFALSWLESWAYIFFPALSLHRICCSSYSLYFQPLLFFSYLIFRPFNVCFLTSTLLVLTRISNQATLHVVKLLVFQLGDNHDIGCRMNGF